MVKAVTDQSVIVTVLNGTACSECHAKKVCSAADLKEKEIDVSCDSSGYRPGQYVNVIMKEAQGMKALFFGYIFPLLLVILILVIIFINTSDEVLAALLSLGVLIPYYAGLFYFRDSLKKIFRFELEKIE
jgi:sigma-E factor negative regulatory protein RseC